MPSNVYKNFRKRNTQVILNLALLLLSPLCLADDWIYTVKKQDTLWDISEKYLGGYTHISQLQSLNNIKDPDHLIPSSQLIIPEKWLVLYPAIARIVEIQGQATIIEEQSPLSKIANVGDILIEGDKVITLADTTLVIKFLDGSQLKLQENSHLEVGQLSLFENTGMINTALNLQKGRLETQVSPKKGSASQFKISTPLSSTSVRGTDYRLSAQDNKAITEVLEGSVAVKSSLDKQNVEAGFGIISSPIKKSSPIKLLPAPDREDIPKVFERTLLQFQVKNMPQAAGYRLQIATEAQFHSIIFDKTMTSTIIRATDLLDGDYFLRIRAIDHNGIEGINREVAITVNALPEPPLIILPKPDSKIVDEQPFFQWTKGGEVKKYHFQLADNIEFNHPIIDRTEYDQENFTSNIKLDVGDYYWRIAAIDPAHNNGPFGDIQHFKRIPPAPVAGEPEITDEGITIQFQKGLPSQTYQFQLASDEAFNDILVDKKNSEPLFKLDTLESGQYFIRGKMIDPSGFSSDFGSTQVLDIPMDRRYLMLFLLPLLILIVL